MVPELRRAFNQQFTAEKYARMQQRLLEVCGRPIDFRICETPCFFPQSLIDELARTGRELILQLVQNPEYRRAADATIPAEWNVPNETERPLFVQVDFGLTRADDGSVHPKLVELQAFPSLYAYQPALAQTYLETYDIPGTPSVYLNGLDTDSYQALLHRAIVADHDPENVVLLEVDPWNQKTQADFALTSSVLGIPVVDIRDVVKRGSKLYYRDGNRDVPICRIYNRTIVDELQRKQIELPFDYRDPLNVEWAGHPNWYFRISKFSLPYLDHPSVPRTWFLDTLDELPSYGDNFVLKPLYSFAGAGITFSPTPDDIAAIPVNQRHNYVLQERVTFARVIDTPHGATQPEIRVMYLWVDELTPVMTLVRMGRGKMMGVDHNKDLEWVGSSASLIV
jgi:hypothetical protein